MIAFNCMELFRYCFFISFVSLDLFGCLPLPTLACLVVCLYLHWLVWLFAFTYMDLFGYSPFILMDLFWCSPLPIVAFIYIDCSVVRL